METSRFAPSPTGPAHPGTLLAALLCWLDARSRGARLVLRLEDLDPERCRPEWSRAMLEDLAWLGLEWDALLEQTAASAAHEAALDRLAADGRLYPCACTRTEITSRGAGAPDGGVAYPGTCRDRPLPDAGWREANAALRVRLPRGRLELEDESGLDLSQDPGREMGDPVVRRRDGAVAYHLAGVVDDADLGVTRVVRGRDLATTTATQVALQRLLTISRPGYRHHLLLLEERGGKLAKLHGAVGASELRRHYDAAELCGALAWATGLRSTRDPITPGALLREFAWERVRDADRPMRWTGEALL